MQPDGRSGQQAVNTSDKMQNTTPETVALFIDLRIDLNVAFSKDAPVMHIRNTLLHLPRRRAFDFLFCQASLIKLSSIFTLKLISAFNALNTFNIVSMVALFALLSSLEI